MTRKDVNAVLLGLVLGFILGILWIEYDASAADNIIKSHTEPNRMWLDENGGYRVPAIVAFTTDGNGNLVPITGGGGGGPTTNVNVHDGSGVAISSTGTRLDVEAFQGGTWSTGRTWNLFSGSDSVSASVSNFPSTQAVTQSGPWTVEQGTPPWAMNLTQLQGLTPGATNSLPVRITDGSTFLDPTQIRPLVASDVVTAQQGGTWTVQQGTPPWSVSQSGVWTTGRTWSLSSGSDSVSAIQGTSPWVVDVDNWPSSTSVTQGTVPWVVSGTVNAAQSGTWNINNISGTVSLPTGASTAAKQPALGIAGTASADVITVQGIAGMTALKVDGSAFTQPVSGNLGRTWTLASGTDSVTDIQGTSPWVVSGTVTANQGGSWTVTANAGTNLNTSALALSATQTDRTQKTQLTDGTRDGTVKAASTASVVTDTSLVVALSPNSPLPAGSSVIGALTANQSVNVAQVNGNTTATGAGTTSSGTQRVVLPTDQSAIPVSESGSWTVTSNQGTSPWVNNVTQWNGNTVATNAGTTTAGTLRVVLPTDQSAIPASQSGTWNINNISGTVSLPTGAATEATLAKLTQTQGSTTSGQSGPLIQGAVTTSAPTYTTAQTSPFSLNTSGGLRTDTTTVGGNATSVGAGTTNSGTQRVVLPTDQSTIPVMIGNSTKLTYSAAALDLATAASATDVFTLTGSATKTVKVLRISVSGITGSADSFAFRIIKRSTANSGGTSSTLTAVPHDSSDGAATATARSYTSNPTLGTSVGDVRDFRISIQTNKGSTSYQELSFGNSQDKPIVLRGTSEVLAINLNGVSITSPVMEFYIEWTEE